MIIQVIDLIKLFWTIKINIRSDYLWNFPIQRITTQARPLNFNLPFCFTLNLLPLPNLLGSSPYDDPFDLIHLLETYLQNIQISNHEKHRLSFHNLPRVVQKKLVVMVKLKRKM
jgi:hypothetical protein